MDLREVGYDDRDWINLAQDRDRWRAYVYHGITNRNRSAFVKAVRPTGSGRLVSIMAPQEKARMSVQASTKNEKCDNAGEMSPGSSTESYPAFARIGLRENPGKNLNQVTCPDRDSNPGHLVSQPDALTVTPQVWTKSVVKPAPEKLEASRTVTANKENIEDFYDKLERTVAKLQLKQKLEIMFNCDETGVTFVVKPSKIVAETGKKIIYSKTFAEKGVTQTVLRCCSASGTAIPPMIIFKGVRLVNGLDKDAPKGSLISASKNGWISSELFLKWINHFVMNISPARPVLLLLDSHASHVGIGVIDFARENDIHFMTFPSHCSHSLQPLDLSFYKSLKNVWVNKLERYKHNNPVGAPTRFDLGKLFSVPQSKGKARRSRVMIENKEKASETKGKENKRRQGEQEKARRTRKGKENKRRQGEQGKHKEDKENTRSTKGI
ncbi:hypothetical protein ANN_11333 [Periplaneta americana]|uniref:DDE-1 domain-containing protein n=1 Tax=Periplaneta americana TaxID=6978 RepID=A0ABQ8T4Q0_PERAM|nr:hypothetical protein ANN_11333 [Periplaneta americana]